MEQTYFSPNVGGWPEGTTKCPRALRWIGIKWAANREIFPLLVFHVDRVFSSFSVYSLGTCISGGTHVMAVLLTSSPYIHTFRLQTYRPKTSDI